MERFPAFSENLKQGVSAMDFLDWLFRDGDDDDAGPDGGEWGAWSDCPENYPDDFDD